MNFYEMILKLKEIYINEIILVSYGAFYIAIGEDAVLLNKKLGLQVNCIKRNVCKVGVPKNSIDKYVEKLNKINYSYIVLDFNKEMKTLTSIYSKNGNNKEYTLINKKCSECLKNIHKEKTNYEIALERYLEIEVGE